jgi:hypothetical protein
MLRALPISSAAIRMLREVVNHSVITKKKVVTAPTFAAVLLLCFMLPETVTPLLPKPFRRVW